MFAVPGWSVSASSLKTQTEASVPRANDAEAKTSRKRKRKSTAVTEENVSNLWAQNFEGKSPASTDTSRPQQPKDGKSSKKDKQSKPVSASESKSAPLGDVKPKVDHTTRPAPDTEQKTNSKKKSKQSKDNKSSSDAQVKPAAAPPAAAPPTRKSLPPATQPPAVTLTPMQQKMREKLVSARFRQLNETLYTAPSTTSLSMFADNPSMFEDYHAGFRRQVSVWPENPVDTFISTIEARAKVRPQFNRHGKGLSEANGGDAVLEQLPRSQGTCTIADLGCGDAAIAKRLVKSGVASKRNLKILSYDLASPNEFIIKADVANLPLKEGSVDIAIFCLALMGTNWIDFIEEAYRVLKWKGELWVAEIKSRFIRKDKKGAVVDHSVGKRRKTQGKPPVKSKVEEQEEEDALRTEVDGDDRKEETDVNAFVQVLARRGFVLRKGDQSIDLGNKMFVRMEFTKAAPALVGKNVKQDNRAQTQGGGKKKFVETEEVSRDDEGSVLKPCLYKIR